MLKSTGVVSAADQLGRIVIPIELRRTLDIEDKDGMEIFTDGDKIVLRKYRPGCVFCSSLEGLKDFAGKKICAECMKDLAQQSA